MCLWEWLCKENIILKYTFIKFSAVNEMTFIFHGFQLINYQFWVFMFNTSLSKPAPFHELMYICLNHRKIQNTVSNHRGHYSFISCETLTQSMWYWKHNLKKSSVFNS